jgi:hypothetical protein
MRYILSAVLPLLVAGCTSAPGEPTMGTALPGLYQAGANASAIIIDTTPRVAIPNAQVAITRDTNDNVPTIPVPATESVCPKVGNPDQCVWAFPAGSTVKGCCQ